MAVNDDCTSCGMHAGSLSVLGSLTRLTRLELSFAQCNHLSSENRKSDDWLRVWRAQRTALGAALCCMPSLSDLTCRHMTLRAEDLPALTSLASLAVGALSPPKAATDTSVYYDAPAPGSLPLPPRLKELVLTQPPSPRLLAALVPPDTLASVHPRALAFSDWDITDEGGFDQLLGGAAAAMRGAVQFLTRCGFGRGGGGAPRRLVVRGGAEILCPAGEENPCGHGSWLAELRPLDLQGLALKQLRLLSHDFVVLAECAPSLKTLELFNCIFPFSALPLLAALPRLAVLFADCRHTTEFPDEETESALLVVCLRVPALEQLTLVAEADPLGAMREMVERVQQALARKGRQAVLLEILNEEDM